MHMSTLIKSFGQLQAAAANIRESTTGAGHAINGALSEIDWKSIGNNVRDATVDVAARVAETYDLTEQTLRSIQWDNVGPEAAKAIKDNRRMLFVAGGIAAGAATGGLLMGLVLGAAGFSSIGPVAASVASSLQSAGLAGSVFSTVQSAAMGGYGVPAVTSFFVGTGAVTGGATAAAVADPEEE